MPHDDHVLTYEIWIELVRLNRRSGPPEKSDPSVSRSRAPSPGISCRSRTVRDFARS